MFVIITSLGQDSYHCKLFLLRTIMTEEGVSSDELVQKWREYDDELGTKING